MILRDLELFMSDNSTPEDPVLEDLYRQTHIRFVNPNMVSGHIQGKLLSEDDDPINKASAALLIYQRK